jgi:uncharacterized integral membrane protein
VAYEPGSSDTSPLGGPVQHDEGTDKKQVTRLVVAGAALLCAALFVAQNGKKVETTFLVFSVRTQLWVGLLFALVLGAVLGQAVEALVARRRRRGRPDD